MKKYIFCVIVILFVCFFRDIAINFVNVAFLCLANHAKLVTFVLTSLCATYAIISLLQQKK